VGVVAYELVSGLLPFNCIYYNRMIKMITENEADIHSLKVSDDFKLMLSKMLEKHPNKRYTASQCLRLPLLLKEEQISISKALDDFNIKLK
jgi:serine/threonine protein kinase